MIETKDLGKRFENFTAVENVNLNVGTGRVLALLGPNGAGKTTTVRMLCSILRPTAGFHSGGRLSDQSVFGRRFLAVSRG